MPLRTHFVSKRNLNRITEMNNGNAPAPSTLSRPTFFIEARDEEDEGSHFISVKDFHLAYKYCCNELTCNVVVKIPEPLI